MHLPEMKLLMLLVILLANTSNIHGLRCYSCEKLVEDKEDGEVLLSDQEDPADCLSREKVVECAEGEFCREGNVKFTFPAPHDIVYKYVYRKGCSSEECAEEKTTGISGQEWRNFTCNQKTCNEDLCNDLSAEEAENLITDNEVDSPIVNVTNESTDATQLPESSTDPPTGNVTNADQTDDSESNTDTGSDTGTGVNAEDESDADEGSDTDAGVDAEDESNTDTGSDNDDGVDAEDESDADDGSDNDPGVDAEGEIDTDDGSDTNDESDPNKGNVPDDSKTNPVVDQNTKNNETENGGQNPGCPFIVIFLTLIVLGF